MTPKNLPAVFDHVVFGIYNLQAGIEMIAEKTGIMPVKGGCHPSAGTCNALFAIGDMQYFEILAPNPDVELSAKGELLAGLKIGAIINWAARTDDINTSFSIMEQNTIETRGIIPGSRKTLRGDILSWEVLPANIPDVKVFPFFIQWQTENHPAITSPKGCDLKSFQVVHNNPRRVSFLFEMFGIDVPVGKRDEEGYSLIVRTPKGEVEFN